LKPLYWPGLWLAVMMTRGGLFIDDGVGDGGGGGGALTKRPHAGGGEGGGGGGGKIGGAKAGIVADDQTAPGLPLAEDVLPSPRRSGGRWRG
jgi:hypothetical protein